MISDNGNDSITIKDVGPNQLVEIPLPAEGGITVLRGRNDRGKSEALKAVSVLAGGKDRISVRRDAPPGTKGSVTGRGVSVVIHKNVRRTGTAEFEVLDGELSIEDIVDPGIKDPLAADAKRIKALLRVSNAIISPKEFYDLCGGRKQFAEAVGVESAFDPLLVATRVRQYLHRKARDTEEQSLANAHKALGLQQAYQDVDLSASADPAVLQSRLEEVLATHAKLQERANNVDKETARRTAAVQQLQAVRDDYAGPAFDSAKALESQAHDEMRQQQAVMDELRLALDQAQLAFQDIKQSYACAAKQYEMASAHEKTMQRLQSILVQEVPPGPTADELSASSQAMVNAREAMENGAKIRDARKCLQQADQLEQDGLVLRSEADTIRANADKVNDVLNKAVASLGVPLKVQNERVVVTVEDGTVKLFDELSMGARRKIALDIAIDAIGPTGLIPLSQESFEGLDFQARRDIDAHLKSRKVNMVTAEADQVDDGAGGNVRATVYEG